MELVVVGAHLTGLPLNPQLIDIGATFVRTARTALCYRLYALPNTTPPKPGLLRVSGKLGSGIDVEVWELAPEPFAAFVNAIPPPLGIGTIALEGGDAVKGFLVESYAVEGAQHITAFGGWRNDLKAV